MPSHRTSERSRGHWQLPGACSAVTVVSVGVICMVAGPIRLIAGLVLLGSFAWAMGLVHRARFGAIVPVIGLTLVFLILAGLALAAIHALGTVPVALAIGVAALAAAWASVVYPASEVADRKVRLKRPDPLAVTGILIFAAAGALAIHYAAASATADANGASSLAIWAYPSGDQLRVGAQQPAGHGATSLRIVVTQAGVTAAAWNNVRLASGQTWEAPALTLTGSGSVQVTALHEGIVVASLSASPHQAVATTPAAHSLHLHARLSPNCAQAYVAMGWAGNSRDRHAHDRRGSVLPRPRAYRSPLSGIPSPHELLSVRRRMAVHVDPLGT